jgi:hypothetical protein
MRKHLYLITEHRDDEKQGQVFAASRRRSRSKKNEERPIQTFDKEAGDFIEIGQQVHLGYVDFEDEADFEEHGFGAIQRKLSEIDACWLEKAGLDTEEVLPA